MDIFFEQPTNELKSGSDNIIVGLTDTSESDLLINEGCVATVRLSRRGQMSRSVLRVVTQARYANDFAQRNFRTDEPVEEEGFYYPTDASIGALKPRKLNRMA